MKNSEKRSAAGEILRQTFLLLLFGGLFHAQTDVGAAGGWILFVLGTIDLLQVQTEDVTNVVAARAKLLFCQFI